MLFISVFVISNLLVKGSSGAAVIGTVVCPAHDSLMESVLFQADFRFSLFFLLDWLSLQCQRYQLTLLLNSLVDIGGHRPFFPLHYRNEN